MKRSFKPGIVISLIVMIFAVFFAASCSDGGNNGGGNQSGGKSVPLTADMISLNYNPDFTVYTGIPIVFDEYMYSISVNGTAANIRDFSFVYRDNVNAGTATVTVTSISSNIVHGSADIHFTILPGAKEVYSAEDAVKTLSDPNYDSVTLFSELKVGAGETFSVPENKTLTVNLNIENYGVIDVQGDLNVYRNVKMYNYGTVNVKGGSLALGSNAELYNASDSAFNGKIVNNGTVYCNGEAFQGIEGNGSVVVRKPLAEAPITIENAKVRYIKGGTDFLPGKINVTRKNGIVASASAFSPKYYDNDYIGIAAVELTAPIDDADYFGEATVNYEIIPAAVTVDSETELYAAFSDPEIDYVVFNNSLGRIDTPFTVPEGYTLDMGSAAWVTLWADTLTVKGTLLAANVNVGSFGVTSSGSVEIAHDLDISGELSLDGDLLYNGTDSDYAVLNSAPAGNGVFVNKGILYYQSESVFDTSLIDNSLGKIYSYRALDGLSNVVVKYEISDPEIMWSSFQTTQYNASEQYPALRYREDLGRLYSSQYRVSYYREGVKTEDLISAGKITMRIEIKLQTENAFRGSADFEYEILRSEKGVSDASTLESAAKDSNYFRVYLTKNIDSLYSLEIAEGVEFDLNGYNLSVTKLINRGTTVIPFAETAEGYEPLNSDCALRFDIIENYGEIVNGSFMAMMPYRSDRGYVAADSAIFTNNGVLAVDFAILNEFAAVSGTGEIIARKYASDLSFELNETVFVYNTAPHTPGYTVTYISSGDPVSDIVLTEKYSGNVAAGQAKLELYTENQTYFSAYYIPYSGRISLPFTVLRGETVAGDADSLIAAANDPSWEKITLTDDILIGSTTFALQENVVLDCGAHLLSVDNTVSISVPGTSAILSEVDSLSDFETMKYVATDIKLLCDIGDNTLNVNIDAAFGYSVELNVDLNGYALNAALIIGANSVVNGNGVKLRFFDSSAGKTGSITGINGSTEASYAVTTNNGKNNTYVDLELENITVYGLNLKSGDSSYKTVSVVATDCEIIGKNDASFAVSTASSNCFGLSAAFYSCDITGSSAVRLFFKEKSIYFADCTVNAYGTYTKPYTSNSGKGYALALNYRDGYTDHVFERTAFTSLNGYAVVQINDGFDADSCKAYFNGCTLIGAAGVGNYYAADDGTLIFNP